MSNFILSILFWIFMWNLLDLLIGELNLKNKQLIIFYSLILVLITVVIYFDKDFDLLEKMLDKD